MEKWRYYEWYGLCGIFLIDIIFFSRVSRAIIILIAFFESILWVLMGEDFYSENSYDNDDLQWDNDKICNEIFFFVEKYGEYACEKTDSSKSYTCYQGWFERNKRKIAQSNNTDTWDGSYQYSAMRNNAFFNFSMNCIVLMNHLVGDNTRKNTGKPESKSRRYNHKKSVVCSKLMNVRE